MHYYTLLLRIAAIGIYQDSSNIAINNPTISCYFCSHIGFELDLVHGNTFYWKVTQGPINTFENKIRNL